MTEKNSKPKNYEEIKEAMQAFGEILELDKIKPGTHRPVDRGAVIVCEGAGHPSHRVYKRI